MKCVRLLVCGAVVSLAAAAASGQSPPHARWPIPDPARPLWPSAGSRPSDAANQPAPRGDLRGDIASNARTRTVAPRQDGAPRRR